MVELGCACDLGSPCEQPVGLDRCELLQLSGAAGAKERFQLPPTVPDRSQHSSVEIKSQHKLVGGSRQRSRRSRSVQRGDNFIQLLFKVELFFWAWIWPVQCEKKASSKPLLSCVRFFLPFFFLSLKHLVLLTVPHP